jgi:hypothetical protein
MQRMAETGTGFALGLDLLNLSFGLKIFGQFFFLELLTNFVKKLDIKINHNNNGEDSWF